MIFCVLICLKLKCCVCEIIVNGILCGLVVVKIKIIFCGGFFKVFKSVLNVFVDSI